MTNSTTLALVTSLKMMMMVVGVLSFAAPQSTPLSENLTILRSFEFQDPVCCLGGSLISMEFQVLLVFQHSERLIRALVASLYPGRSHGGPACLLESRLRKWTMLLYRALCQ